MILPPTHLIMQKHRPTEYQCRVIGHGVLSQHVAVVGSAFYGEGQRGESDGERSVRSVRRAKRKIINHSLIIPSSLTHQDTVSAW